MAELRSRALLVFAAMVFLSSISSTLADTSNPLSDSEIDERKDACYADVKSGLWGQHCRSSVVAMENCTVQCLSPVCYEHVYASDPLEEGEKDYRSKTFKYCMRKT